MREEKQGAEIIKLVSQEAEERKKNGTRGKVNSSSATRELR